MATAAPTSGWSASLEVVAGASYTYTATPGVGGSILIQWSADGTNWTNFMDEPVAFTRRGRVPLPARYLRAIAFSVAGTFDAVASAAVVSAGPQFIVATASYGGIMDAVNAATAAGGGTVKLPAGVIDLSSAGQALPFVAGVLYEGVGNQWDKRDGSLLYTTLLLGSTSFNCFEYNPTDYPSGVNNSISTEWLENTGARRIHMDGFKNGVKLGAFNKGGAASLTLDFLAADNCAEWGFWIENIESGIIQNLSAKGNLTGQIAIVGSGQGIYNHGNFNILNIQGFNTDVFTQRGVWIGARGSGSSLNHIFGAGIQCNGSLQNYLTTVGQVTVTNGVQDISVPDLTKFPLGMPLVFTTTVGNLTANVIYFIVSRSAASGAGTIQIGNDTHIDHGVITPSASSATVLINSKGYPVVEIGGDGSGVGAANAKLTSARFFSFATEAGGTASMLFHNAVASYVEVSDAASGTQCVATLAVRNMQGYSNQVHSRQRYDRYDFDASCQRMMHTGVEQALYTQGYSGIGIRYNNVTSITNIDLLGGPGIALSYDTVLGITKFGTWARYLQSAQGDANTINTNQGQVITPVLAGAGTQVLPTASVTNVGLPVIITNPSAFACTVSVSGGGNIFGGGVRAATNTLAAVSAALYVCQYNNTTYEWARVS